MSNSRASNKIYKEQINSPTKVEEAAVTYNTPVKRVHLSRIGLSTDFVLDLMQSYQFSKQETSRLTDISTKTLDRHLQSGKRCMRTSVDHLK